MSPLWCLLCLSLVFVNLCYVEAGGKSQEDVIVINNGGGGSGCGGGAKTIVKTGGGGKKKGKKGKGHKIILTSSSGKCGKEHKVSHIPLPIPIPHYEHHHHGQHHGWGGMERRTSGMMAASNEIKSTMQPSHEKGDRGQIVSMPYQVDPHRMDFGFPMDPMAFVPPFSPYGFNPMPYM
ncbi:uncharacterized protein LOC141849790 [Brevipalpus obovatus]|uniref:uncharacterized protein LOC141849790 n=1 Tax=Brevipalpus obovatus TaxID=246614 RepID=UPI003D9EE6D5